MEAHHPVFIPLKTEQTKMIYKLYSLRSFPPLPQLRNGDFMTHGWNGLPVLSIQTL